MLKLRSLVAEEGFLISTTTYYLFDHYNISYEGKKTLDYSLIIGKEFIPSGTYLIPSYGRQKALNQKHGVNSNGINGHRWM